MTILRAKVQVDFFNILRTLTLHGCNL